ncbi:MAG TPA: LysR substrate-binding domain-containing protein, partial [Hydrogenophaga sp.]
IGAITSPGLTLLPAAVALAKQEHPSLRISLEIETSPVLLDHLEQGKLDVVLGRLYAEHDKTHLRYEPLTEEMVCAVARPGHPLLGMTGLGLRDVHAAGWIVPPEGSVLRHRFDLMFQQEGLAPPINIIETPALLFITRMLQQSDMVAVLAADVAHYYASHGIVSVLPLAMPCHMDAFGIITRSDRLLSPGAKVMMKAIKQTSLVQYGRKFDIT